MTDNRSNLGRKNLARDTELGRKTVGNLAVKYRSFGASDRQQITKGWLHAAGQQVLHYVRHLDHSVHAFE
jgi:hypothetical protein